MRFLVAIRLKRPMTPRWQPRLVWFAALAAFAIRACNGSPGASGGRRADTGGRASVSGGRAPATGGRSAVAGGSAGEVSPATGGKSEPPPPGDALGAFPFTPSTVTRGGTIRSECFDRRGLEDEVQGFTNFSTKRSLVPRRSPTTRGDVLQSRVSE